MLATIDLDHKPSLQAGKVDDVRTHRNLTAEAVTIDPLCAQAEPEMEFRIGHSVGELAGTVNIGVGGRAHIDYLQ